MTCSVLRDNNIVTDCVVNLCAAESQWNGKQELLKAFERLGKLLPEEDISQLVGSKAKPLQDEAENEQNRQEKEEAALRKQLALEKKASLMERFHKRSKNSSSTSHNDQSSSTKVTSPDSLSCGKKLVDGWDETNIDGRSCHRKVDGSLPSGSKCNCKQLLQFDKNNRAAFYGIWSKKRSTYFTMPLLLSLLHKQAKGLEFMVLARV
ncbi:hypothetical protein LguiB_020370 [Lonicera macranthoides]